MCVCVFVFVCVYVPLYRGEPENMRYLTSDLVESYVRENNSHSLYLIAVPATSAPNQSLAFEVVQKMGLHDRCELVVAPRPLPPSHGFHAPPPDCTHCVWCVSVMSGRSVCSLNRTSAI